MDYKVTINGIPVEAHYSEHAVDEIFVPLLKKLTELQMMKQRRILMLLAAPPGAGKSTLLSFLEKISLEREELMPVQVIGMDGFHRYQEYLLNHFVNRDGRDIPMVKIKGAPVTFDLEKLKARVADVAGGKICGWPVYDRLLHNPVEDAVMIEKDIVILEGNYLLLDEDGWKDISDYADFSVFVCAEEDELRKRLIERRIKTGVEEKASAQFVDFSDMPNVRLCLEHSKKADLTLGIDRDGDYYIIEEAT
jgi:pantothenate kinase